MTFRWVCDINKPYLKFERLFNKKIRKKKKGVIDVKKWGNSKERGKRGWLSAVVLAIALLFVGWFFYANQRPIATLPTPPVAPVVIPVLPVTGEEKPPAPVVEPPAVEIPPKEEPMAPEEPPVVEVPPVEEPPAPPVPEIPSNFIVPDEVWENAFLLNRVDGTPYKGFIGFSDIPIGTKLYAPMDGYIHYLRTLNEKNEVVDSVAILTQSADWSANLETKTREVYFLAREIKVINTEPKKGEAFATILNNSEMSPDQYGWYNRKTLLTVFVDEAWSKLSDRNIEDPKDYLSTIFKLKR